MNISLYYLKPQYEEFFRQSFDTIVNTTNANPKKSYYEKVFSGKVDDKNSINDLFTILTDNMPSDFVGHDFGVSDVIGIDTDGDKLKAGEFYFCDIIGWDRLKEWEEPKQTESLIETIGDGNTVSYWATDGEFRGSKIRHNEHGEGVHFFATLEDALSGAQLLQKTHLYEIHHKPLTKPLVIDEDLILWSGDHIAELLLCKLDNKDYDIWGDGKDFIKPSQVHIDNLTEDDRPILQSINGQKQDDFDKVYDFIKSKGFDHIKYKNTQELQNGDSIIVNPDDIDIQYPLTQVEYKRNESMDKKQKALDPKNVFGKRVLGAKKEAFDLDRYELLDHKRVYDSDGFTTDYALYFDHDENNYFTVFGDMDLYTPDNSDHDMDFDNNEEEALDWFAYYDGIYDGDNDWFFADSEISHDVEESVDENKPSKTELRRRGILPARGKDVGELHRYYVGAFFDRDYRGLEDNLSTDDYSEAEDFAWKYYQRGDFIQFKDQKTGKEVRIDGDNELPIDEDEFLDALIEIKDDAIKESVDDIPNWFKSLYYEAKEKYGDDRARQLRYITVHSDDHANTVKWLNRLRANDSKPIVWDRGSLSGKRESCKESVNEDGWEEVSGRNGYRLFRKIEDGKGKWRAQKCVNGKCEGEPFDITYAQALGREPIEDKPIAELSKKLGKILLPKREGVKESYDDILYGIAERLVKLYQEYDWYDYNDSLEIGETEEDAIEKELAYLQSVDGIKSIIKGLKELDMEWNDSGMGVKAERDRLVADLKGLLRDYRKTESLNESGRPLNRRERTSYITKLVKALMAEPYNYDHETANDIAIRRADNIDYQGYVKEYDGTIDDMVKRELRFTATKAEYDNDSKTESVGGDDAPLRVCRQCLMGIEAHEGKQRAKHIYIDDEDTYDDHDEWERDSKCDWCEETGFDELWEI